MPQMLMVTGGVSGYARCSGTMMVFPSCRVTSRLEAPHAWRSPDPRSAYPLRIGNDAPGQTGAGAPDWPSNKRRKLVGGSIPKITSRPARLRYGEGVSFVVQDECS